MTLIAANVEVAVPDDVQLVRISSAEQLAAAATELAPKQDVIIMAAAVADFRPDRVSNDKIKKESTDDTLTLTFTKNPDILRNLVEVRPEGQLIVGFAAETEADDVARLELARAKVKRKGSDLLVLNRVGWDHTFGREETEIQVLNLAGDVLAEDVGDKLSVADTILDVVVAERSDDTAN